MENRTESRIEELKKVLAGIDAKLDSLNEERKMVAKTIEDYEETADEERPVVGVQFPTPVGKLSRMNFFIDEHGVFKLGDKVEVANPSPFISKRYGDTPVGIVTLIGNYAKCMVEAEGFNPKDYVIPYAECELDDGDCDDDPTDDCMNDCRCGRVRFFDHDRSDESGLCR